MALGPTTPGEVLQNAVETGRSVRIHLDDGEVVVARVLSVDHHEVVYAALQSSRPERYAVCDSTGARARLDTVAQVVLLAVARPKRKRGAQ
jgi:hypothetical protein